MAESKSIARKSGSALADIRKQLQEEAEKIKEQIGAPPTNAISTRDKVFTLPDGTVLRDSIDVVILDFVSANYFYEGKWDPKNPQPPVCWAIGRNPHNLIPSDHAPQKQAESCSDCPMNEFGSDGDGKACKNTRRLAVMLADEGEESPIYTLSVPPTAIKGYDGYVAQIARLYQVPPFGVVTQITFHPERSYALPLFGNPRPVEDLEFYMQKRQEAEVILFAEPEVTASEEPAPKKPAAPRRGRVAKKKVARKR